MPLSSKGRKIRRSMRKQYGPEKAERVFYASINKGTIKGVEESVFHTYRTMAYLFLGEERLIKALRKGLKKSAQMVDPKSERGVRLVQASEEALERRTGQAPTAQTREIHLGAHRRVVDRATGKRGRRGNT